MILWTTASSTHTRENVPRLHEEKNEQPREVYCCFAGSNAFDRIPDNGHVIKNEKREFSLSFDIRTECFLDYSIQYNSIVCQNYSKKCMFL